MKQRRKIEQMWVNMKGTKRTIADVSETSRIIDAYRYASGGARESVNNYIYSREDAGREKIFRLPVSYEVEVGDSVENTSVKRRKTKGAKEFKVKKSGKKETYTRDHRDDLLSKLTLDAFGGVKSEQIRINEWRHTPYYRRANTVREVCMPAHKFFIKLECELNGEEELKLKLATSRLIHSPC